MNDPTRSAPPPPSRHFRLRGLVGSSECSFLLSCGIQHLGNSKDNDLVVQVSGVSRLHARLDCRETSLKVEDLESRNGTFVNERRITASELRSGDVVRFGPVQLRLEQVDERDVCLGLVFEASSNDVSLRSFDETTALFDGSPRFEAEPTAGLVFPAGHVPGRSEAMSRFYRYLGSLAGSDLPVLIEGQTGVGKESAAQALHLSSPRRDGPFVAVNCAAIPTELLEAEMFGVGGGVATGVRQRPGRFRAAEGGTLLLDEIAEMPLALQAKLLRALQEKEIQPLGGRTIAVNVRVLAATNFDLRRQAEEGRFRRDLYYRVAGGVLRVPPLSERKGDIALLIEHFLRATAKTLGKSIRGVTVGALEALERYSWPGNVRELEHEAQRLAHLCADGLAVESALLPKYLMDGPVADDPVATERCEPPGASCIPTLEDSFRLRDHVRATERRVIAGVLEHVNGCQRQAAALLGISRTTLGRKIEQFGLRLRKE